MIPVLRFRNPDDAVRAAALLVDQQFEPRPESETEILVLPREDMDEAFLLLQAEGVPCERALKPVVRLGPRKPGLTA